MKWEKVYIPTDRIWIKVNDLDSAIEAWNEIQQDIAESSGYADEKDYDEV